MRTRELDSLGAALIGAAALAAAMGWLHMKTLAQTYGVICGSPLVLFSHCAACHVSAALFVLGLAALTLGRLGVPATTRLSPRRV